jgi:methyltransferase (TIGR00027 family)
MGQGRDTEHEIPKGVGLTALLVAQARATESKRPDRLFDDPFAEGFIAGGGAEFAAQSQELANLLRLSGDSFVIRTRFLDDFLLDACQAGCRQVVLLGSGLDTRAFRLEGLEGVRLFELDLPDVLAFKEGVLAARSARPRFRRVVVGVDLREDWPKALVEAGFLVEEPTAWLFEGILMYLTEDERDRLIDKVGELSVPGSRLALDQKGAADVPAPGGSDGVVEQAKRAGEAQVARLGVQIPVGQPDPSMMDPGSWLTGHGWRPQVYNAAERFIFYGRPVPPLLEAGVVRLWLVSAERS